MHGCTWWGCRSAGRSPLRHPSTLVSTSSSDSMPLGRSALGRPDALLLRYPQSPVEPLAPGYGVHGAPGAWLWWPWSPWRLAMLVVVPAPGDVEVLLFIICLLSAVKLYLYL